MALRGYELLLFVRAQNQASATLRRVANDVRALSRVEDLSLQRARVARRELAAQNAIRARQHDLSRLQTIQRAHDARQSISLMRAEKAQLEALLASGNRNSLGQFMPKKAMMARIAELTSGMAFASREVDDLGKQVGMMPPKFWRFWQSASATSEAIARNTARLKELQSALGITAVEAMRLDSALRGAKWERLTNVGRTVAHIGRAAQLMGLVTVAAFGAAAKSAADFETQVSLVASQARNVDAPLASTADRAGEIDQQIKQLMRTFPAASEDMTASAYEVYSGINLFEDGVANLTDGMFAMNLANKASVAGQADLADSTSLLITLANNFGDSQAQMSKSMDTAFDIVRFGRLRISDLNEMMNKIAPAAKAAGQSIEQLGGSTAFLTTVIPSQKQVATGMARLLDFLRHPDIKRGLKEFGVDVEDASGRMRPFNDIMQEIVNTFPELRKGNVDATNFFRVISQRGREARTGRAGLGLVSTIEGRRVFTQLVQGWDQVLERQRQVEANTGELQNAYERLSATSGVRFQKFVNNLKVDLLELGANSLPVFEELGGHIRKLSGWWEGLDEVQRKNVGRWVLWAGVAVGLGGVLASITGSLVAMVGTFGALFAGRGLTEANVGRFARFAGLVRVVGALAGAYSVSLIVKAGLTGDATAMNLLQGMVAGAAAGAGIGGPWGALAGAVVVPLAITIAARLNKPETTLFQQRVAQEFSQNWDKDQKWVNAQQITDSLTRQLSQLHLYGIWTTATTQDFLAIMNDAYAKGQITGIQFAAGLNLALQQNVPGALEQAINFRLAETVHDPASSVGAIEADNVKQAAKAVQSSNVSKIKQWQAYYEAKDRLRNADKKGAIDAAKVAGNAEQAALQQMNQAASMLMQKFNEIKSMHTQNFGQLFGGDWLTGERANISEEWGIKAGIEDLTKDLRMQLGEFNRFNSAIAAIAARGAPAELVKELQALGPDALDKIEALRKGAPGKFNEFIAVWKQKQNAIQKATTLDFSKQLAQWRSYGTKIMTEILMGLRSEDVKLENYFRNMVHTLIPGFVGSEVAKAVADAKANAPKEPKQPKRPGGPEPKRDEKGTLYFNEGDTNVTIVGNPGEGTVAAGRRAAHAVKAGARSATNTQVRQIAEDWGITPKRGKPRKNPPKGTGMQ